MNENVIANCMTLIVGKKVSAQGRVMVAHNEDDSGNIVLYRRYVPAADHTAGELIPAENGRARIPQVAHTLGYYWVEYLMDEGGCSASDSYLNECGVVVTSNSMGISKEDNDDPSVVKDGGLAYVLRRALAERAHTAREGADILMQLIDEWCYAPSGRAYTIADKDEAFMFQLVRGRHYVGARVPDDAVVVMPNHYSLHTLNDCPEMFYSADIVEYAVRKGWYVPKDEACSDFDFAAAYQSDKTFAQGMNIYRHKHGQRIILGRDWDLQREGMPFAVYPDHVIDLEALVTAITTHYEGTEDDCDLFGPGSSPHYSRERRRICAGTTLECDIWMLADDPRQTLVYTALGRPCEVPLVPLHPLMGLPACLKDDQDPAIAMAQHLNPHPGICAVHGRTAERFTWLCGAQEMLYGDVKAGVRAKLRSLFDDARRLTATATEKNAVEADAAFLGKALEEMEAHARARFNIIRICAVSDIDLGAEDGVVEVEFVPEGAPIEDTLYFGVTFTSMTEEFSAARPGTLRRTDRGWIAAFDLKPMLPVLPTAGRYSFWLGGKTGDGRVFAAEIAADVRR